MASVSGTSSMTMRGMMAFGWAVLAELSAELSAGAGVLTAGAGGAGVLAGGSAAPGGGGAGVVGGDLGGSGGRDGWRGRGNGCGGWRRDLGGRSGLSRGSRWRGVFGRSHAGGRGRGVRRGGLGKACQAAGESPNEREGEEYAFHLYRMVLTCTGT